MSIGESVVIKGEVTANEDLTIAGTVEGKINLRGHALTIGQQAKVVAAIVAKTVVVVGNVTGNVTGLERIEVRSSGTVRGDIAAPRLAIIEGAHIQGKVDMPKANKTEAPKAK